MRQSPAPLNGSAAGSTPAKPNPPRRNAKPKATDKPQAAADPVQQAVREIVASRHEATAEELRYVMTHTSNSKAGTTKLLQDALRYMSPRDAKDILRALKVEIEARTRAAKPGPDPDLELNHDTSPGAYPYQNRLSRKSYEAQKYRLQVELLKMWRWVKENRQRVIILFEGRDAAGKGGTIKRMMEHLNPRGARVVALEVPSETERGQW